MMMIIDFDAVLFDDIRFKLEFRDIFIKAGISSSDFLATYERTKKINDCYDSSQHLMLLQESYPNLNMNFAEEQIEALIDRSSEFIFAETKPFLEFCKK